VTPPQPTPQPTPKRTPITRRPTPPSPQPAPQPSPQRSPQAIAADNANFEKAKYIGTPEAYALYLRLHPTGLHAAKAKRRTR